MNSIKIVFFNICNLLFVSLYNSMKMYINPDIVDESELDIELHGNKNYLYGVNKDI